MLPLLGVSVGMTFLFVIAIAFSCILFLQTKAVQQSFFVGCCTAFIKTQKPSFYANLGIVF
ncbi:MAG: hypothetical protein RM022_002705 [Nostoc sp. EfeVER01]|uniref:hypothetical protein n=2 Tax=unclassified Nostoc TaxID=2593658 RepID=UPI002AD39904|nr:hypothetical protein [Nostoc sp. EfeVER01]MDZ7945566.1 hypothetical protein [Nostoc sp. EfeVER01]